jgi:hypothetical protein
MPDNSVLDKWCARPDEGPRDVVPPSEITPDEAATTDEIGAYHPSYVEARRFRLRMEAGTAPDGTAAAILQLTDAWPSELRQVAREIRFFPEPPQRGDSLVAKPLDDIEQPHMNGWQIVEWTVHQVTTPDGPRQEDRMKWRKVSAGRGLLPVGSIADSVFRWLPYSPRP